LSTSCVSTSRFQHRDDPGHGCPSAALLDEVGGSADATKRVYTDGVLSVIGDFAVRSAPHDPQSANAKVLSIYAVMIGPMQLSRALADRQARPTRSSSKAFGTLHAGARRR
jgi:TetR/AcrR family transcriptional regulator, transcriptional repressor for nem operon